MSLGRCKQQLGLVPNEGTVVGRGEKNRCDILQQTVMGLFIEEQKERDIQKQF